VAAGGARRIEIDIGEQHMYVWQGDTLVWSWVVSTGMAGYPTRRGSFAVQSKIPNAWSGPWQLWMPHWLGIYWAGGSENGIHALPILNGVQLWEGSLGTPISYGCVVLGVEEARLLYDWAEIGTPVEIRD
jgi:lipoprotein-anchoring transpeptidase ErfK/SrfK